MDALILRWLSLVAVLGTLGISAYYRHRARRTGEIIARSREALGLKLGRAAVALPLFGGVLAYLISPRAMAWSELPLPAGLRWAGAALALGSVPAAWWVFRSLGRNVSETVLTKSDHALVTSGPYRLVRHPLYATGTLLWLGVGLAAASWFVLLFAAAAAVLIRIVVVPLEERALLDRFGDAYRDYMQRTGGMLPRS